MASIHQLILGLQLIGLILTSYAARDEPAEYCEDDMFTASCSENEAIVIQKAVYGRMREGRCVSGNYGHIGCSIDVQSHLDRWCSGRPSCEIPVTALLRGATKPCPKDFRSFLEASYTCVPVMSVKKEECPSASFVEVTARQGYISSRTTEETGCGSIDTPWLIKAKAGQRVNITLWDFDIINRKKLGVAASQSGLPPPCHVYAIIKERSVTSSKTVCPNDARQAHVFTSLGDTVEIRIVTKKQEEDDHGYFLLHFQSIGCPDVVAPHGGWTKRLGERALVGCDATDEEWRLTCHKDAWIGSYGNCTKIPNAASVSGKLWNAMSSSQGISIAIIIGVAVLVGILILVGGLVCLKWQRQKRPHGGMNNFSQVTCYNDADLRGGSGGGGTGSGYNPNTLEKHRVSMDPYNSAENNYYRTWQLQQRAAGGGSTGGGNNKPHQSIQGTELPPPPYHPISVASDRESRYAEHVYESPKFERREISSPNDHGSCGSGSGDFAPVHHGGGGSGAQYFELDPDAVDHHNGTIGRGVGGYHPSNTTTSGAPIRAHGGTGQYPDMNGWNPHVEVMEAVEGGIQPGGGPKYPMARC